MIKNILFIIKIVDQKKNLINHCILKNNLENAIQFTINPLIITP